MRLLPVDKTKNPRDYGLDSTSLHAFGLDVGGECCYVNFVL